MDRNVGNKAQLPPLFEIISTTFDRARTIPSLISSTIIHKQVQLSYYYFHKKKGIFPITEGPRCEGARKPRRGGGEGLELRGPANGHYDPQMMNVEYVPTVEHEF